jgi:Uma2 family endonuclease
LRFAIDDGIVVVEVGKENSIMPTSMCGPRRKQRSARMTTAEYLQTGETTLPRELAYGVLRVAESPIANHQRVVRELVLALAPFVRDQHLGEVLPAPMDVILDFDAALVVQPDVLFVSEQRRNIISDRLYGAPDLVIEVLSPHPRIGRTEERVGWFARYGVRECWLADLATRQIRVLTLNAGGIENQTVSSGSDAVHSSVLPGVPLTPQQIFGW